MKGKLLIFICLSMVFFSFMVFAQEYCCEFTQSGDYCKEADFNSCNADDYNFAPGSCANTDFCKPVCCVTSDSCFPNVPKATCENEFLGTSYEDDASCGAYDGVLPECTLGCCNVQNLTCEVTSQPACEADAGSLAYEFEVGLNETQCGNVCEAYQERGCCTLDTGECFYIPRIQCNGDFSLGTYCSQIPDCNCTGQFQKGCCSDNFGDECNDDVIWFDSCNNFDGIADDCDLDAGTFCGCEDEFFSSNCEPEDLECKFVGCASFNVTQEYSFCDNMVEERDLKYPLARFKWHKFTMSPEYSGSCQSRRGWRSTLKRAWNNYGFGWFGDIVGIVWEHIIPLGPIFGSCGEDTHCPVIIPPAPSEYSFIGGDGFCGDGLCNDKGLFMDCDAEDGWCKWGPFSNFGEPVEGEKEVTGTGVEIRLKADSDYNWLSGCDDSRTKFKAVAYFDLVDGIGFEQAPDLLGYEFGDRHYVRQCSFGEEILLDACKDAREEICLQGGELADWLSKNDATVSIEEEVARGGRCVENNWENCNDCGPDCNTEKCAALGDCVWADMWFGEDLGPTEGKKTCVPKYPPARSDTCGNCYDEDYTQEEAAPMHHLPLPGASFGDGEDEEGAYIDCTGGCVQQWQCGNQECVMEGDCYWAYEFPANEEDEDSEGVQVLYANTYCLPIEAPDFGNCSKCNIDDLRPCSEYVCESLGKNCMFDSSSRQCYVNGSFVGPTPIPTTIGTFDLPCVSRWLCEYCDPNTDVCSSWSDCTDIRGFRFRECRDINYCSLPSSQKPSEQESCLYVLDCIDNDEDGYGQNCWKEGNVSAGESEVITLEGDCDDNNARINPAADEICDGLDNDCDNTVDETCPCTHGQSVTCGETIGICSEGVQVCYQGRWGLCGGINYVGGGNELCDNDLDDDCDGMIDEGCDCEDGETKECGSDVGMCEKGVQTCVEGTWSVCEGETVATIELCNDGKDNDCDGAADGDDDTCGVPTTHCNNNKCDGDEDCTKDLTEQVDCGGSCITCSNEVVEESCYDGLCNQDEDCTEFLTDQVDCGGIDCAACVDDTPSPSPTPQWVDKDGVCDWIKGEPSDAFDCLGESPDDGEACGLFNLLWIIIIIIVIAVIVFIYYKYGKKDKGEKKPAAKPPAQQGMRARIPLMRPRPVGKKLSKRRFKGRVEQELEKIK